MKHYAQNSSFNSWNRVSDSTYGVKNMTGRAAGVEALTAALGGDILHPLRHHTAVFIYNDSV